MKKNVLYSFLFQFKNYIIILFLFFIFHCNASLSKKEDSLLPTKKEESPSRKDDELEFVLSFVSGNVSSGSRRLTTGDTLKTGSLLRIGENSIADIQPVVSDLLSTLRLEKNSEISFGKRKWDGKQEILVFLRKGEMTLNSKTLGFNKLLVVTPTIQVSIFDSSKIGIIVEKDGTTKLEVYSGDVQFRFALKEEVDSFPFDFEKNPETLKFISEHVTKTNAKLTTGERVSVSIKQRDEFVRKRQKS